MSTEQFAIRTMRSSDVERVLKIAASLKNVPRWPRSAYLSALDPHAALRRVALVAEAGASECPAGFVIASVVPPSAELETIAVAEDRQGQGLGRALLEKLFEELQSEGIREMWLEVRASNEPAVRLYRRMGFVETGCRKAYYADPVEDASVMGVTI